MNVTVPCVNRQPRFSLSEMKKKWEKDGTKRKIVLFVCSWWGKSASEIHGSAANSRIIFQGNSTRINPLNPRVREGKHARKLLVSVAGLRRCWISSSYLFFFFFLQETFTRPAVSSFHFIFVKYFSSFFFRFFLFRVSFPFALRKKNLQKYELLFLFWRSRRHGDSITVS